MACEQVKAWLSRPEVELVVREVDTDQTAYDALLARGYRTVPVAIIGERVVVGFKPHELADALSAAQASADRGTP